MKEAALKELGKICVAYDDRHTPEAHIWIRVSDLRRVLLALQSPCTAQADIGHRTGPEPAAVGAREWRD